MSMSERESEYATTPARPRRNPPGQAPTFNRFVPTYDFVRWSGEQERYAICGMQSACGPRRETLACAYAPGHAGTHSWATLPTFIPDDPELRDGAALLKELIAEVESGVVGWHTDLWPSARAGMLAILRLLAPLTGVTPPEEVP